MYMMMKTQLLGSAVIDGEKVEAKDFEYISNANGHYHRHGDFIVEVEMDQKTKKGLVKVHNNPDKVSNDISSLYIGNNFDLSSDDDDFIV